MITGYPRGQVQIRQAEIRTKPKHIMFHTYNQEYCYWH